MYINNIKCVLFKKSIYVISMPIGNKFDISIRALYILKNVDLILSENINLTNNFIKFFLIKNKITSFNKNNEFKKYKYLLKFIINNKNVAIVSKSGTPLINDPGYILIKKAQEQNIKIFSVPGPCAAISAISISGLDTSKFCYEGFIPKKKNQKISLFKSLYNEKRTIIFYESPLRLISSLKIMKKIFNYDKKIIIFKEITKIWEDVIKSSIDTILIDILKYKFIIKGEIVIILEGNLNKIEKKILNKLDIINILKIFNKNKSLKNFIKILSKLTKLKKNYIYSLYLKNK